MALANRERAARAGWLIDGLDLDRRGIKPITGKEAIYLRLPVMVRDRETKEAVCRQSREVGAGLSPSYPATIQEIPELAGRLASRKCAGAQEVVDRLVTLPTHQFVTEDGSSENRSDIGKQGEWTGPHEGRLVLKLQTPCLKNGLVLRREGLGRLAMNIDVCMQTAFWISIGFICYAYLGYPLLLMLIGVVRNRPVEKGPCRPTVSFIITAYNEEQADS